MIVDQLTSRHICSQLTSVSTDALPNLPLLWIVMDLESTGLNLARDRITQIAAFAYLTGMNEFVDSSEFHCYAICCGSFSCFVCPQVSKGMLLEFQVLRPPPLLGSLHSMYKEPDC